MAKKLIDNFRGEPVIIFIKSLMMSEQDENGSITSGNIIAKGYYLSSDKEYIYLGNELGDLVEVISKSEVARISLDDGVDEVINDITPEGGTWN